LDYLPFLLSPLDASSFYEDFYEKTHLHLKGRIEHYFDSILTLDEIDGFLQQGHISPRDILMTKNHSSDISDWTDVQANGTLVVNKEKIFKCLSKGYSLVLNSLNNYIPRLNKVVSKLSAEMNCGVRVNVYITPPSSQAFESHIDKHDVLVIQLSGYKKWRAYDNPLQLPDGNFELNDGKRDESSASEEIHMNQGDLLYLPRGLRHDANTTEQYSIHASIGLYPVRWLDIVINTLRKSEDLGEVRRSFPFWKGPSEIQLEIEEVKTLLQNSIANISNEMINSRYNKLSVNKTNQSYEGRLQDFLRLSAITENYKICRRYNRQLSVTQEGGFIIVEQSSGERLSYPVFLKDTLDHILSGQIIRIKDLGGPMDMSNKVKFVKKMIADGLVRLIR